MPACRAIPRPNRSRQPDPAPLTSQGPPQIRGGRVLASRTHIACTVPAKHGRRGANGARAAIQIRRVTASNTPGEQVVLARAAQDAGATCRNNHLI